MAKKMRLFSAAFLMTWGITACRNDSDAIVASSKTLKGTQTVGGAKTPVSQILPLTDAQAIGFLKENCSACHGSKGQYNSFWPLKEEGLTKETLEVDSFASNVYQALLNKSKDLKAGEPSAMPPRELSEDDKKNLQALILWFQKQLPVVVADAQLKYHSTAGLENKIRVDFSFVCKKPVSFREYLNRVTQDAFQRAPTPDEIALAPNPSSTVTLEQRNMISKRIFSDSNWRKEFMDKGLKKYADKMAGTADIVKPEGVPANSLLIKDETITDLRSEFYELLKHKFDKPYHEILLSEDVMVSNNTYTLYESCASPDALGSDKKFVPCKMVPPRYNFFTTVGYLLSKPTSFLEVNNNYGRVALMHFIVGGEVFKPATSGPKGEKVNPLPSCFKTEDFRGERSDKGDVSPFGSARIPASGNVCQSCHIGRQMAAGSMLFRPFSHTGELITKQLILNYKAPDTDNLQLQKTHPHIAERLRVSVQANKVNQKNVDDNNPPSVSVDFIANLLDVGNASEQSCIPGSPDKVLSNIKDLTDYIVGDGVSLARGLSRHLPRAMSNLGATTPEIMTKITEGYAKNSGKLQAAFETYFATETYACENAPN